VRGGCLSVYTLPHFLVHTHYVDEQKKAVRCRDANTSRANREDNGIITDAGCLCTHYQLFMIVQLVVVSRRRSIYVGCNIDYKITHQIISCYVSPIDKVNYTLFGKPAYHHTISFLCSFDGRWSRGGGCPVYITGACFHHGINLQLMLPALVCGVVYGLIMVLHRKNKSSIALMRFEYSMG